MAFFIGGDTSTLEYDFGLKVANSVAECPLKIYKQEVDPAALPNPTTGWTEVTSQSVLDKLKTQNELPVTAIASDLSNVTWNGKTLPKTATLKVLDDFVGKVAGSTVVNPHIHYRYADGYGAPSATLMTPLNILGTQSYYSSNIETLNGVSISNSCIGAGNVPQHMFSFNLIEMFERKYGAIPSDTTAGKVTWLKINIDKIAGNAYIYGVCPAGNKVYLAIFKNTDNTWQTFWNNNSSSPSILNGSVSVSTGWLGSTNSPAIDSNGFVHFLAYTDAAKQLVSESPYNTTTWAEWTKSSGITADGTGLLFTGDNTNNKDATIPVTSIKANTKYGLLMNVPSSSISTGILRMYNLTDTAVYLADVSNSIGNRKFVFTSSASPSTSALFRYTTGVGSIKLKDIQVIELPAGSQIEADFNTMTADQLVAKYPMGALPVAPSTIYTDYISLELTLKAPETLITATNTLSDIVTDFTGKVSGSTTVNANISKWCGPSSSLMTPTAWTGGELPQADYTKLSALDGTVENPNVISTNGAYSQQLFSFNIIAAVEKQLGQPIPAVDKVQWCKDNIYSLKSEWSGYGVCPTGNKAYFMRWSPTSGNTSWDSPGYSHTSGSVTTLVSSTGSLNYQIQSNGFVHFLASTDASDGVTASTIYTDYVKLTIKLKYIPTYDFYTDSNTRRDAGLTDIILVKRKISDMTSDFTGKVSGSVVENPNIYKISEMNFLLTPNSGWTERGQSNQDNIKTLNGNSDIKSTSTNTYMAQQLFQFNLIAIVEKALGTSIYGADTAGKVQWLKDNLYRITCDWYGYGSCPTGNKACLGGWTGSSYFSSTGWKNTSNTPTLITLSDINVSPYIDATGFANMIAYTDASDGVTASVINTDYVKLTLTFKTDTVGYEYFTNNSTEVSVTTINKASALLIECDLTNIATAQYGGSNAALKAALKSINVDAYTMATGVNNGVMVNGVLGKIWDGITSIRYDTMSSMAHQNSAITKTNFTGIGNVFNIYINSSNKLYIIIYSQYKSDGSIASEVNLDYINIKIGLSRIPDTIAPISVNLPKYWAMVGNFSHSFDSSSSGKTNRIFSVYADANNRNGLFRDANYTFGLKKVKNGVGVTLASITQTFSRNQMYKYIVGQSVSGMFMYLLKNNGTVEKYTNTNTDILSGTIPLHLLNQNGIEQSDAFVESFHLLDLERMGKSTGLTDAEATNILKGTLPNLLGLTNPELFDKTLSTTQTISALPNNQYQLKTAISTVITEMYNNIVLKATTVSTDTTFIAQSKTNKIKFDITGSFSNLSLKRLD